MRRIKEARSLSRIQSSLNSARVSELPEVYHRPQVSESVKTEFDIVIRDYDQRKDYGFNPNKVTEFENTKLNALRAFDSKVISNYGVTKQLTMSLNHAHRRGNTARYLARIALEYCATLGHFNICWMCYKPVKVTSASVSSQALGIPFDALTERKAVQSAARIVPQYKSRKTKYQLQYADVKPYYRLTQSEGGKHEFYLVTMWQGEIVHLRTNKIGERFEYFLNGEPVDYKPIESFRMWAGIKSAGFGCECRQKCGTCNRRVSIHANHKH